MSKNSDPDLQTTSLNTIYLAALLLLINVAIGIVGYRIIEGFSFVDSLYMVIITVATVGFGEVAELTQPGKFFTIYLIVTSLGIFAYVVTSISRFVIDGGFRYILRKRKLIRRIKNSNHNSCLIKIFSSQTCSFEILNSFLNRFI